MLDRVIQAEVYKGHCHSINRQCDVIVSSGENVRRALILVLSLPSKCKLEHVKSFTKAIVDITFLLVCYHVLKLGIEVLFWTVSLEVEAVKSLAHGEREQDCDY